MKKFLAALVIGLSLVTFTLDASAARLGGGASFGRSMSVPKAMKPAAPVRAPQANSATRPAAGAAAAGAAAKQPMSMGKRLLLGAAGALGLMALANMLGLGEGFAQFLMIALLAMVALAAFRMFMARREPQSQTAKPAAPSWEAPARAEPQPAMRQAQAATGSVMDQFASEPVETSSFEVPADFDKENFLNMASSYFKMLQKAWDSGDMDSLANYCTDDMFIELTHKRREIKGANLTEIVNLKPSLAGFETTDSEYVASVLFSGRLKENGEPVDIEEIWNLVKARQGKSGWLLAGIEQA